MRLRLTSALAAAVAVALIAGLSGPAAAVYGAVAVFPTAGTPVASPTTQISFRNATPGELTGIKVRGSQTGSHSGQLRAHSDGHGATPDATGAGKVNGNAAEFTWKDSEGNTGTGTLNLAGDDIIVSMKTVHVADPRCLAFYREKMKLKRIGKK